MGAIALDNTSTPLQSRDTSRENSGFGSPLDLPNQPELDDTAVSPPTTDVGPPTQFQITESHVDWFEGCEYTCQYEECLSQFHSSDRLTDHITKYHLCALTDYKALFKSHSLEPTKTKCYECKVCQSVIIWNRQNITKHLR